MRFEAEAAPLLRDRVAEQTHLLGLVAQIVGHPVVGQDLLLARDHGGADEVTGLGQDLLEVVVVDDRGSHESDAPLWQWALAAPGTILYEI